MKTCKDCIHYDCCHYHITEETSMTIEECSTGFLGKDDVAPVAHGEWIKISYTTLYKCSVCTDMIDMPYQKNLFNYCPKCGARMDGGNEE